MGMVLPTIMMIISTVLPTVMMITSMVLPTVMMITSTVLPTVMMITSMVFSTVMMTRDKWNIDWLENTFGHIAKCMSVHILNNHVWWGDVDNFMRHMTLSF